MKDIALTQKMAIYNLAILMMSADGKIVNEEILYFRKLKNILELTDAECNAAASMTSADVVKIVQGLTAENKVILLKLLTNMATIDGRFDTQEYQVIDRLMVLMDYQKVISDLGGLDQIGNVAKPYQL